MGKRTNISTVLRHQGRSDRWFYRQMGISESLFYAIENGSRRATEEYRRKAAEVLGVPEDLLFLAADSSDDDISASSDEAHQQAVPA